MSKRLQVLVPASLDARIQKAAQRRNISKGEWVRQTIERALKEPHEDDPIARLSALGGPTADIDQMIAEIDAGRR